VRKVSDKGSLAIISSCARKAASVCGSTQESIRMHPHSIRKYIYSWSLVEVFLFRSVYVFLNEDVGGSPFLKCLSYPERCTVPKARLVLAHIQEVSMGTTA
jgi:hypothetical protein